MAESNGVLLSGLTLAQLQTLKSDLGEGTLKEVFDFEKSLERKSVYGGPARKRVLEQIAVICKVS